MPDLPTLSRCYDVHGLTLGLHASDPAVMAALHARLEHFPRADGAVPALLTFTFRASDPPWVARPTGPGRPVYTPGDGEVLYFDETDQLYMVAKERVRLLCTPSRGQVEVSYPPDATDLWLLSRAMFTLPLLELLKRRGRYSLHAAALCPPGSERALLIPGSSGSGKTTLSLALLRAGFGFMSDDLVFLADADGVPDGIQDNIQVCAFPDELDITPQTALRFLELHPLLGGPKLGGLKHQACATTLYQTPLVLTSPPAALIFPRIVHSPDSRLCPMNPDEALLELAPNILLTDATASQAHLDHLATLVKARPCYRLHTGQDFDHLPALLAPLAEA